MNPVVYILQSKKNNRFYIGSTNDIDRRLEQHNKGLVISTKNIRPLELKAILPCDTIDEARIYEHKLKDYKSRKIVEKVIVSKIFPWKY
jgi:putative endonuclease